MPDSTGQLHVVFGAGQVGPELARQLLARGHAVRLVSRSVSTRPELAGLELVRADAGAADAALAAARGATSVYHCINTAYSAAAWTTELPRINASLVGAARAARARLVVLDNLYAYGRGDGGPMRETTAERPCSAKGEARARLAAALLDADRRGDVRVVLARASDFFGPGGLGTQFESRFWKRVLAGKSGQILPDPDVLHSYHFIPDVARGLGTLGQVEAGQLGDDRLFMLPCQPATSTRALIGHFALALGRPIRVQRIPTAVRKAMGWFVPILREVEEMLYQWHAPFVVDDSRFRARFRIEPTAWTEAADATVAWARRSFSS